MGSNKKYLLRHPATDENTLLKCNVYKCKLQAFRD